MKRYIVILLALLVVPVFAVEAQGKKKKGKAAISPVVEGKKKVRMTDYDSVWMFTTFNVKKTYFCAYDYRQIADATLEKVPDWQSMQPVMNFITNGRAPVTFMAVYGINPVIDDEDRRAEIAKAANAEALELLQRMEEWTKEQELKNKMVFRVAQVDYRYFLGNTFFTHGGMEADYKPLGFIIAFTNKEVNLFPDAAAGARTFADVKFFPNDATVVPSYNGMIDSLAAYVMSNDRYEVLLTGYSDNVGTAAYNHGLSHQRAFEIKKMLMLRGVPDYRIEVVARGEKDPIGDNKTYEGRVANNRVAIKIQ